MVPSNQGFESEFGNGCVLVAVKHPGQARHPERRAGQNVPLPAPTFRHRMLLSKITRPPHDVQTPGGGGDAVLVFGTAPGRRWHSPGPTVPGSTGHIAMHAPGSRLVVRAHPRRSPPTGLPGVGGLVCVGSSSLQAEPFDQEQTGAREQEHERPQPQKVQSRNTGGDIHRIDLHAFAADRVGCGDREGVGP